MKVPSCIIPAVTCTLLLAIAAIGWASSCLQCHPQAGKTSHSHVLSCVQCHGGHEDKPDAPGAHEAMTANPSDFINPTFACARCHEDQARWVNRTLMSTAAGIINQTRFLWGAQKDAAARYAVRALDDLQALPKADDSGPLVDDLLRRRCLRCHLGTSGVIGSGETVSGGIGSSGVPVSGDSKINSPAGAGCAACHVLKTLLANEGNTTSPSGEEGNAVIFSSGADHAIFSATGANEAPLPPEGGAEGNADKRASHRLTTAIPTSQCLQCHNGNHAGADYAGLFERDHSLSYNFEARDPEVLPYLQKHSYHYLLPDVHYERGMHCIDCHPVEELMGEGKIHSQSQGQVGIRCVDCHGLPGKPPKTRQVASSDVRALRAAKANGQYGLQAGWKVITTSGGHLLTNTVEKDGSFLLTSKVDGKVHRIPVLGREPSGVQPLNHRIPGHMDKMECTACHAAWTFQDMGLHLVRQDSADYGPWSMLTRQGDPQAYDVLESNISKPQQQWSPPSSRDRLSGFSRSGIWLGGYSMRRWEGRVLGVNFRGLVSALRPQHQYWLSWVDYRGQVLMDSITPRMADGRKALAWNPYAPHTTRTQTADCWDCHGNSRALGLGQKLTRAKDGRNIGLGRPQADGLGIDFDLDQVIDDLGRPLQVTSRDGAGFLAGEQLDRMSARNPLYIKYLLEFYEGKEAYGDPAGFTGPKK